MRLIVYTEHNNDGSQIMHVWEPSEELLEKVLNLLGAPRGSGFVGEITEAMKQGVIYLDKED